MAEKFYGLRALDPLNSGGAWTLTASGNLVTYVKTPAADTTTLLFHIARDIRGSAVSDPAYTGFRLNYVVATASLSSAPTAVVNLVTYNATTRVISRAAVTQNTIAFAGTNTVGTAAGTYSCDVSFAPQQLLDNQVLTVEITFVAAATTALSVGGGSITYQ